MPKDKHGHILCHQQKKWAGEDYLCSLGIQSKVAISTNCPFPLEPPHDIPQGPPRSSIFWGSVGCSRRGEAGKFRCAIGQFSLHPTLWILSALLRNLTRQLQLRVSMSLADYRACLYPIPEKAKAPPHTENHHTSQQMKVVLSNAQRTFSYPIKTNNMASVQLAEAQCGWCLVISYMQIPLKCYRKRCSWMVMQIEETQSAIHYFPFYALFLSLGLGDLITSTLFNVTIHHTY